MNLIDTIILSAVMMAGLFYTLFVMVLFVIWAVYSINGARGFRNPFWQIYALAMAEGLFDRFFIDTYWVGHTRAWTIPGTEDLKPYIPRKTLIVKWAVVDVKAACWYGEKEGDRKSVV